MRRLWLAEELRRHWDGCDPFAAAAAQQGQVVKAKDRRRTLRFLIDGKPAYLKYHDGVGWREILKSLLMLRWPVLDAAPEYRAAQQLRAAGVPSLQVLGFGSSGMNPARRRSFLVTQAIEGCINLENWCATRPPWGQRRLVIESLATLVAAMHAAGINHRDLYLCHVLLEPGSLASAATAADVRLHLIDLHRAQLRQRVPPRWRAKDLGALYFSALQAGATRHEALRFLRHYLAAPLRQAVTREAVLLAATRRRAARMRRRVRVLR
jgi:heptose I phosphotransferase